jgi:hypothetical protein
MRKTIIEKREKKKGVSTLKYSYTTGGDYYNNQSSMRQSRQSAQKKPSKVTKSSNSNELRIINKKIEEIADKLKGLFSEKHRMQKLQKLQMLQMSAVTLSRFAKSTLTQRKYADDVKEARIIDEEQKRTSEQSEQNVDTQIDIVQRTLNELYKLRDILTQGLGDFIPFTEETDPSTTSMRPSSTSRLPSSTSRLPSSTSMRPSSSIKSSTIRQQSIDNSELMMNNLRAILTILTDVWRSTIKYDQEKNNVEVYLGGFYRFNFVFKDIDSIRTIFINNYSSIYSACSFICSDDIKDLNKKLKNSKNDKDTYDIIIALLTLYINENINKSSLKDTDKEALRKIKTTIDSLEQIRGGKLRKVRKTNVIKKRTTRVIRNKKL